MVDLHLTNLEMSIFYVPVRSCLYLGKKIYFNKRDFAFIFLRPDLISYL